MVTFSDFFDALVGFDFLELKDMVANGADINCRDSFNRTVLHYAALTHTFMPPFPGVDLGADMIKVLVHLGANVNASDMLGMTPLHYVFKNASEETDKDLVKKLKLWVGLGADINAKYERNVTSLHRAVQFQNKRAIETLLSLGVDVNAAKMFNCTALQQAVVIRKMQLADCSIKLGADIDSACSNVVPIIQAVESGRLDIFHILIQNGASINKTRYTNKTTLMLAADKEYHEMIKWLAKSGADLNATKILSSTVPEIVKSGRIDMLEYLVNDGYQPPTDPMSEKPFTALTRAIANDDHAVVEVLADSGADVNQRNNSLPNSFVAALRRRDVAMIKAMVDSGFMIDIQILTNPLLAPLTLAVSMSGSDMLKLLLRYGDVNTTFDYLSRPMNDAVARGDLEMVRVLTDLGADINATKLEGITLFDTLMKFSRRPDKMEIIKVLVEAGIKINEGYSDDVTALHDAVKLGDTEMVQALCYLGADINAGKREGLNPLLSAIDEDMEDVARYLISKGADTNVHYSASVTPLHDAVQSGNAEMVYSLIGSGARSKYGKEISPTLHRAIHINNNKMVKCLLECDRTNINAKRRFNVSPFYEAAEHTNVPTTNLQGDRTSEGLTPVGDRTSEGLTPVFESIYLDLYDITETLLTAGADLNIRSSHTSPRLNDLTKLHNEYYNILVILGEQHLVTRRDNLLKTPLFWACTSGYIDLARLLIINEKINGRDFDPSEEKPLESLPFVLTADYHVLKEASTSKKVAEVVPSNFVSVLGVETMPTLLHTPGLGDVQYIPTPRSRVVAERVKHFLQEAIAQDAKFHQKVQCIGSAAEGTKVGLTNEMDLLFDQQMNKKEEQKILDLGHGYVKYKPAADIFKSFAPQPLHPDVFPNKTKESYGFHTEFMSHFMGLKPRIDALNIDDNISLASHHLDILRPTNRKACSFLRLQWKDESTCFYISVDLVPSLHVDNWPNGATTKTWLMDEPELRSRGYVLVPKPPHVDSNLAKQFTEEDLQMAWKISFPHLETEHMQRLEQRIKDVYLTAKCLRNPDVCRILILEEGKLPRPVDKYITSYQLKMCFFQNVEHFRQTDLSLEEMVCKVYTDLEEGLSRGFIPLFFLPKVNALGGIKLDVPKCVKVARIMGRFVQGLYLRDRGRDECEFINDEEGEVLVYQRKPSSVYNSYKI